MRGLAALSVVVLHLSSVFLDTSYPEYGWVSHAFGVFTYTPLAALWAGSSAVALFFILSGYALHRMFRPQTMSYAGYAARRVTRLWLPYAATLAVAWISISLVGSHKIAGQSDWLNSFLGVPLSASLLLQHLLMVGEFDTKPIDFVVWSLVIEMRISLVFPLIFRAVECNRPWTTLAVSVLVGAASIVAQHRLGSSSVSLIATLGYQTFFVLGALMSKYETPMKRRYDRLRGASQAVLLLAALTLYCGLPASPTYTTLVGAAWIMVAALCSLRVRIFLGRPWVQWLGRISYSLYLCHVVVLLTFINAFHPRLSFGEIVLSSIPAIFLASVLLHRFVELPAIALSRTLGRHLGGSLQKGAVET